MSTAIETLCKNFPPEFASYMNYCRQLCFDDKPDYAYLRRLFRELFYRKGYQLDYQFDWTLMGYKNAFELCRIANVNVHEPNTEKQQQLDQTYSSTRATAGDDKDRQQQQQPQIRIAQRGDNTLLQSSANQPAAASTVSNINGAAGAVTTGQPGLKEVLNSATAVPQHTPVYAQVPTQNQPQAQALSSSLPTHQQAAPRKTTSNSQRSGEGNTTATTGRHYQPSSQHQHFPSSAQPSRRRGAGSDRSSVDQAADALYRMSTTDNNTSASASRLRPQTTAATHHQHMSGIPQHYTSSSREREAYAAQPIYGSRLQTKSSAAIPSQSAVSSRQQQRPA